MKSIRPYEKAQAEDETQPFDADMSIHHMETGDVIKMVTTANLLRCMFEPNILVLSDQTISQMQDADIEAIERDTRLTIMKDPDIDGNHFVLAYIPKE